MGGGGVYPSSSLSLLLLLLVLIANALCELKGSVCARFIG